MYTHTHTPTFSFLTLSPQIVETNFLEMEITRKLVDNVGVSLAFGIVSPEREAPMTGYMLLIICLLWYEEIVRREWKK